MVDDIRPNVLNLEGGGVLEQLLHGYSDGHRLLQGSRKIPDDLSRLVLRMSDLSGSSQVEAFDEYLTGYPLPSLSFYAFARTWYAPEMPRPGCVWTHTLLIPFSVLEKSIRLDVFASLFKRPSGSANQEGYDKSIPLSNIWDRTFPSSVAPTPNTLSHLLFQFYADDDRPMLLPAQTSRQFEAEVLALWSQQWPALRKQLTFCTGSLSARTYGKQPLDLQCIPASRAREISLSIGAESSHSPDILDLGTNLPEWAIAAANDASAVDNGSLRDFLWSVAGPSTNRHDFGLFIRIFEALHETRNVSELLSIVANTFPTDKDGSDLKHRLLGPSEQSGTERSFNETDILFALATTEHYSSFDSSALELRKRGASLWASSESAVELLTRLFHVALNPIGEEVLSGLISTVTSDNALVVAANHPELLPTLFREKPDLAVSTSLWCHGGDRKRELFDSVAAHEGLDPSVIEGVVSAVLDIDADWLILRALEVWRKDGVYAVLNWIDRRGGEMSEACRQSLTFHVRAVMEWVRDHPDCRLESLISIAHVVAPYSNDCTQYDSTVWRNLVNALRNDRQGSELTYVCTFILALGLGNAPPRALDLLSESFERIHDTAGRNQLGDDAWVIMEPLVPQLSRYSNWDKCERLRRALVIAFVRHRWTTSALKEVVREKTLRKQVLKSARKVDGGEEYFSTIHVSD